ncbi:hypothetical protein LINPERHAP1_LOCUS37524 [Linum perenne]
MLRRGQALHDLQVLAACHRANQGHTHHQQL